MTDNDPNPNLPGRVRLGRVVSLAGVLGLCVSFFLPNFGILGPASPAEEAVSSDGWSMLIFDLPFLAAILLLPLLTFRAVPQTDRVPGVGKFLAVAVCAICLFVLTIALGWMTWAVSLWAELIVYAVAAVTSVSLVLAIVAMVKSGLPRKAAAAQFALGMSCLAYFAYFTLGTTCAGLWISIAASAILAIGSAIDWFQSRPEAR